MRQIVLDTETTGLEPKEGHRIIEIGCVEVIGRRLTGNNFHRYIQPDREIDDGAIEVHGITNEFLADKPRFSEIVQEFLDYIKGAELVIHNAAFDVGFMDHEFALCDSTLGTTADHCSVVDSLMLARRMHPGQRNSLDALCKRYDVDNSQRELHGALLDAQILADVYLAMTGGQTSMALDASGDEDSGESGLRGAKIRRLPASRPSLLVITPTSDELAAHQEQLIAIEKASGNCLWKRQELD